MTKAGHKEIIEFFGMPGAGKTTVSLQLQELLVGARSNCVHNHQLDGSHLPAAPRNTKRALLILREFPWTLKDAPLLVSVWNVQQRSIQHKAKALFNIWTVLSVLSRARRRGACLVLDQGPLQAVWSLLLASKNNDIDRWIKALSPDPSIAWHVVVVNADLEQIHERLETREEKHSRLQGSDELWGRAEELTEKIADRLGQLNRQTPLVVTEIDTVSNAPEDLAKMLFSHAHPT